MRYMILIAGDESQARTMKKEEGQQIMAAYQKYTDDLMKAGVLLAGDPLTQSTSGVRITTIDGKRKLTDGPFSESKEVVGGYYLIQAKSKEEAVEWAARCPGAQYPGRGYVELREVMEIPT